MDKIIKKTFLSFITGLLTFSVFASMFSPVYSANFKGEEDYWFDTCSTRKGYDANPKECEAFKVYIKNQQKENDKNLQSIKGELGSITGDIDKDSKIIKTLNDQVEDLNKQIAKTKSQIDAKQRQIDVLNRQIKQREEEIEVKKEQAREYMVHVQSTSRVNSYLDFLMGASDFSEISRRVEGMNRINEKNQNNIRELNVARKELQEHRLDLEFDQKNLEAIIKTQEESIKEQEILKQDTEVRIKKLRAEYAALTAAKEEEENRRKVTSNKISNIKDAVSTKPPSTGSLAWPISSGFRVSAGVWNYPGDTSASGKHIGLDLASSVGTAIVAPANGIVIGTNKGCPTYGGYPQNNCNSGYGNYVLMIVNHQGTIYGILYGHMMQGGVLVNEGTPVNKGQQVGRVGSSGNSTGPHVHAEIYFLGNDSIEAAYDRWYNGPRNTNFGAGPKSVEYANRCEVKGMNAPCRLNPSKMWGLNVGDSR